MITDFNRTRIMVIDDEERNLRLIEAMLIPHGYEVFKANDGETGLKLVNKIAPDVILLDIMMPGLDGFEVTKRLKKSNETSRIPIIIVTALTEIEERVKALELGADDFLSKPVDKSELVARVKSLVKVKAYNDHILNYQRELEEEVAKRTGELQLALSRIKTMSLDTIFHLSRAAEYKDEDTGAHIKRMSNYAACIAKRMGLPDEDVESILYAAPMHDVGKIGIPDRILLKPGKLNSEEWIIMCTHTSIGEKILTGSDSEFIKLGAVIALNHHEKWDGSGYPRGLRGEEIPLPVRIITIADVFDALTSRRPYRLYEFSSDEAYKIIEKTNKIHFDPSVFDVFKNCWNEILKIKDEYSNESENHFYNIL